MHYIDRSESTGKYTKIFHRKMERNNSDTAAEVRDKTADCCVAASSPIGSLEKSSDLRKLENSDSFDSDESDVDLTYECALCKKRFSGIKPLRQHERSGKHLKALKKTKLQEEMNEEWNSRDTTEESSLFEDKFYAECGACKKQFTGVEAYQLHSKSKAHKKKILFKKLLDQAKEDGKINVKKLNQLIEEEDKKSQISAAFDTDEYEDEDLNCPECEKAFTGLESLYDHLKSKTHKKILKQKELLSKLMTGTTSGDISGIEVNEEDIVCKLCKLSFTGPENVTAHLKSRRHLKTQEERVRKKALKERTKGREDVSGQDGKTKDADESAQASVEREDELKENTLLRYSKYKEYKEITKDAQFTQVDKR